MPPYWSWRFHRDSTILRNRSEQIHARCEVVRISWLAGSRRRPSEVIPELRSYGTSSRIRIFGVGSISVGAFSASMRRKSTSASVLTALAAARSEEHTSELQSPDHLVC